MEKLSIESILPSEDVLDCSDSPSRDCDKHSTGRRLGGRGGGDSVPHHLHKCYVKLRMKLIRTKRDLKTILRKWRGKVKASPSKSILMPTLWICFFETHFAFYKYLLIFTSGIFNLAPQAAIARA